MRLLVRYPTKRREQISDVSYRHIYNECYMLVKNIYRHPCGTGAAANRYKYEADFYAPDNAEFVMNGVIRANIDRKKNPKFNPKKLEWDGQHAAFNSPN